MDNSLARLVIQKTICFRDNTGKKLFYLIKTNNNEYLSDNIKLPILFNIDTTESNEKILVMRGSFNNEQYKLCIPSKSGLSQKAIATQIEHICSMYNMTLINNSNSTVFNEHVQVFFIAKEKIS